MHKETLVLINSFGTNSILLKGVINYIGEFFNVDFVDLPGFISHVPPLKNICLQGYIEFVEDYLSKKTYNSYLLGGISFGYLIAANLKNDPHCWAMVGMEPFLGTRCFRMNSVTRVATGLATEWIENLGLSKLLWKHPTALGRVIHISTEKAVITSKEVDPKMFFKTAHLLLNKAPEPQIPNKPHVLFINPNDTFFNTPYIEEQFRKATNNLYIIPISTDHYPKNLSREYFEHNIPRNELEKMVIWLEKQKPINPPDHNLPQEMGTGTFY